MNSTLIEVPEDIAKKIKVLKETFDWIKIGSHDGVYRFGVEDGDYEQYAKDLSECTDWRVPKVQSYFDELFEMISNENLIEDKDITPSPKEISIEEKVTVSDNVSFEVREVVSGEVDEEQEQEVEQVVVEKSIEINDDRKFGVKIII